MWITYSGFVSALAFAPLSPPSLPSSTASGSSASFIAKLGGLARCYAHDLVCKRVDVSRMLWDCHTHFPFKCLGSGSQSADPSMGFARRVLLKDEELPNMETGILSAVWALDFVTQCNACHLADTKQVITLSRANGKWKVRSLRRISSAPIYKQ